MPKIVTEIAIGVALVALAVVAPEIGVPLLTSLAPLLEGIGISLVLTGIGSLFNHPSTGVANATRNPVQPWNGLYGFSSLGGTLVYLEETGTNDEYLHMVVVLACHPCESIGTLTGAAFDGLFIDNRRILFDSSTGNSQTTGQTTHNITSIQRVGELVTVTTDTAMPLTIGDQALIKNITTDATLNGYYTLQSMSNAGMTFTYICGGSAVTITSQGEMETTFPNYSDTIHVEYALGNQTTAFAGLTASGDTGSNGQWTANCKLQGKTCAYVRLRFDATIYSNGIPNISFVVQGKNNIYDPRDGTYKYTANAALCIADYLSNTTYGFKAAYSTEIPDAQLIAAANICDETVALANGLTEARYECNGGFQIDATRGTILQNLLTSCAARLTYVGGQFSINPGAWVGSSLSLGVNTVAVPGTSIPYAAVSGGSGLNHDFFITGIDTTGTPPVQWPVAITAGETIAVNYVNGLTAAGNTSSYASFDANGNPASAQAAGTIGALMAWPTLGEGGLVGAFVTDAGVLTANPFPIGLGGTFVAPLNTTRIQFGVNDGTSWSDNTGSFELQVYVDDGSPVAPSVMDISTGAFSWSPKLSSRDLYNGCKANFVSPGNLWARSDAPMYAQDSEHGYSNGDSAYDYDLNLTEDGGDRRFMDIQLPFTTSKVCAQRLCKITLLRLRGQGTATFNFNMYAYQIAPLDIISMTLPVFGWVGKQLEVVGTQLTMNKGADGTGGIALGTTINLQEADPSIYDWDASTEELYT